MTRFSRSPIVSVVVPCFNQARFLGEAISSVLDQHYPHFEVIVVNDGSPDDTSEVAKRYPQIQLIEQNNRGLPAARNVGAAAAAGEYLVFLDADDRLLAKGLSAGVASLENNPMHGFAYGRHVRLTPDGMRHPAPVPPQPLPDVFAALLRRNFIGSLAAAMLRRSAFEEVGGFQCLSGLSGAEDYDLFLRLGHRYPAVYSGEFGTEYRQHRNNMHSDAHRMLRSTLLALARQRPNVASNTEYRRAYRAGRRHYRRHYGRRLILGAFRQRGGHAAVLGTLWAYTEAHVSVTLDPVLLAAASTRIARIRVKA